MALASTAYLTAAYEAQNQAEQRRREYSAHLQRKAQSQTLSLAETERLWDLEDMLAQNTLLKYTPHGDFLEALLKQEKSPRGAARRGAGANMNFTPDWLLSLSPDDRWLAEGLLERPGNLPSNLLDRISEMSELPEALIQQKNLSLEATRRVLAKLNVRHIDRPVGILIYAAEHSPHSEILSDLMVRGWHMHKLILRNQVLEDSSALHHFLVLHPILLDAMSAEKKDEVQEWLWTHEPAYNGMPAEWAYKLLNGSEPTPQGTDI